MTATGFFRRFGSRRVALAAAGVGAAVVAAATIVTPTETVAAFADNVWAGAGFTAGGFSIWSKNQYDDDYGQHSSSAWLELPGSPAPRESVAYSTTISLQPDGVSYGQVFLQTTPGTSADADVTLKAPNNRGGTNNDDALLAYVNFGARAVPVTGGPVFCDDVFSNGSGTQLYPEDTTLSTTTDTVETFTVTAAAGNEYQVCFKFWLDPDVVTGASTANGKSVYPMWEFLGEQSTS